MKAARISCLFWKKNEKGVWFGNDKNGQSQTRRVLERGFVHLQCFFASNKLFWFQFLEHVQVKTRLQSYLARKETAFQPDTKTKAVTHLPMNVGDFPCCAHSIAGIVCKIPARDAAAEKHYKWHYHCGLRSYMQRVCLSVGSGITTTKWPIVWPGAGAARG